MKKSLKSNRFAMILGALGVFVGGIVFVDAERVVLTNQSMGSFLEPLFGRTSTLSLSDVTHSTMKPVWCEMDGGYALMLDPDRQLSDGILLKQQVGDVSRYFELVPDKLIMLGYSYDVRGVGIPSYGTVSLSMHALYNSHGAEKVYELNISNVNALNSTRDSFGVCRFDKPAELPQNASSDGYTQWDVVTVQDRKYAFREMIVDGRRGVYYEFGPHKEGRVAPAESLSIGFAPSTQRQPEQPVMFISKESAAEQAHQVFTKKTIDKI